jgi:hypothetical protein
MIPTATALLLAAQLATPQSATLVADRVANRAPAFNTDPTCQGAGTADVGSGPMTASRLTSDHDICKKKESDARAELDGKWTKYPAADRALCVSSTASGGVPSYVELLTCLEMEQQARQLPKEDKMESTTTGSGVRSAD